MALCPAGQVSPLSSRDSISVQQIFLPDWAGLHSCYSPCGRGLLQSPAGVVCGAGLAVWRWSSGASHRQRGFTDLGRLEPGRQCPLPHSHTHCNMWAAAAWRRLVSIYRAGRARARAGNARPHGRCNVWAAGVWRQLTATHRARWAGAQSGSARS